MRLPAYLTRLSPVGETLRAVEAGEALLARETAARNDQLCVGTASEGLSLWEADYGLPDRTGSGRESRRTDIRTAMAGGRTLTPACLAELAVTLGAGNRCEVEEDFPRWRVELRPITEGGPPAEAAALRKAVEKLKPAHLEMVVTPHGHMGGTETRYLALSGGLRLRITGRMAE